MYTRTYGNLHPHTELNESVGPGTETPRWHSGDELVVLTAEVTRRHEADDGMTRMYDS